MYLEVFRAFKFLSDKSQQANWQNWHTNWRMYGIGPAAEKRVYSFGFIHMIPSWLEWALVECRVHFALTKCPINQFKPVQQNMSKDFTL